MTSYVQLLGNQQACQPVACCQQTGNKTRSPGSSTYNRRLGMEGKCDISNRYIACVYGSAVLTAAAQQCMLDQLMPVLHAVRASLAEIRMYPGKTG